MNSLTITKKEASKVTHDINYEWHEVPRQSGGYLCYRDTFA